MTDCNFNDKSNKSCPEIYKNASDITTLLINKYNMYQLTQLHNYTSLKSLYISNINFLDLEKTYNLDIVLPLTLISITITYSMIDSLPAFPKGIKYINIHKCTIYLRKLPKLPVGLLVLNCYSCNINKLPIIPDTVEYLDISYNPISVLPRLPYGLKKLFCTNYYLEKIINIPEGLTDFTCMRNQLVSVPYLPDSINNLSLYTGSWCCKKEKISNKIYKFETDNCMTIYNLPEVDQLQTKFNIEEYESEDGQKICKLSVLRYNILLPLEKIKKLNNIWGILRSRAKQQIFWDEFKIMRIKILMTPAYISALLDTSSIDIYSIIDWDTV